MVALSSLLCAVTVPFVSLFGLTADGVPLLVTESTVVASGSSIMY